MRKLQHISIHNFALSNGETTSLELTYQVFGQALHTAPIVLINHALTGNSNVTGINGWWNDVVGDQNIIDTQKYTILCFNIPGNGFDNKEENLINNYKDFTANDIAKIFEIGLYTLNIDTIHTVIGASLGGGITWHLAVNNPNLFENIVVVASHWKADDWLIANTFIQDNILNNSNRPMEDARTHAMTFYRTATSFNKKFEGQKEAHFYAVENWLQYHGNALKNRFQLSSYKLMNHLLKTIEVAKSNEEFTNKASKIAGHIHLVTINTDGLFLADNNWETYIQLKPKKENVSISEIKSIHGHDAFLIEFEQLSKILKPIFQLSTLKRIGLTKYKQTAS